MNKYQIGGEDNSSTDFFNSYVNNLINSQEGLFGSTAIQEEPEEIISEDDPFLQGLQENNEEVFQSFYNRLDEYFNTKLQQLEEQSLLADYFDTDIGQEQMSSYYSGDQPINTTYDGAFNSSATNSDFFSGIFRNEGARTGQPTNLNSSAIGRGQMIKGTRMSMYRKLGITNTAEAERRFRTDPNFEQQVMNAYKDELDGMIPSNIQGYQRQYMLAKGWYTGDPFYPDNKVPGKSAGNRLTARQYALRALGQ